MKGGFWNGLTYHGKSDLIIQQQTKSVSTYPQDAERGCSRPSLKILKYSILQTDLLFQCEGVAVGEGNVTTCIIKNIFLVFSQSFFHCLF